MQSEVPIYEELVTDYGDPFARLPHDEVIPLTQPMPKITQAELEASIEHHPAGKKIPNGKTGHVSSVPEPTDPPGEAGPGKAGA